MPRKSIFRFSLKSPKPPSKADPSPNHHTADFDEVSLPADPEARYIPRQWAPNRLQTLYVTPSEQNLYLAAMAQLDRAPPPLPLWTDPAPILPAVPHQPAMDPTPPSVKSPPRKHVNLPMSPKFVTSPGMPIQGLSIREEFRSVPGNHARSSDHALLALSDDSQLRFHGFPLNVLVAIEETLKDAWPRGRRSAHPSLDDVGKKPEVQRNGITWIVILKGNVWRQAGHSELDSIRLILALLTTLSIHGWTLVDRMQAAGVKYDNHNLLFAHSPQIAARPPTYFALSIPLPDRISLISPPPKATPAIISTVREAIQSHSSKRKGIPNRGTGVIGNENGQGATVEWDAWKGNIRLEGWVHAGVYRFWLGGMRRWLGNGVKWRIVEKLHPSLILSLINSLSSQHFSLLTSLPLLPLVKGRDILIFASQPSSGLTFRDTWKSQPSTSGITTRSESPVMVQQEHALPVRGELIPRELEDTVDPRAKGVAKQDAAGVMAAERRQAGLMSDNHGRRSATQSSPKRQRHASLDVPPRHRQPSPSHTNEQKAAQPVRRRSSTIGSANPLTPANASTPRQRNLLVKKSSLRRNGSFTQPASRSSSLRRNNQDQSQQSHQRFASLDDSQPEIGQRPDQVHITSRHGISSEVTDDGEWSFVNIPKETGLGLSMYAPKFVGDNGTNQEVITRNLARNEIETPMPPPLPARPTATAATNTPSAPPLPPRPMQPYTVSVTQGSGFTTVPQPVITPIRQTTHQPESTRTYPLLSRPTQAVTARPNFDSGRSVYVDAETPGRFQQNDLPPAVYDSHAPSEAPDSATYDMHTHRNLMIANPTPPPRRLVHSGVPMPMPVQMPIQESLNVPLSQPASPLKGRDAMVDVGSGLGAISVRGSVGYMPSLASQSVLGLTPAPSEGPILGAWNEGRAVDVPMPNGAQGYSGSDNGQHCNEGSHERRDRKERGGSR